MDKIKITEEMGVHKKWYFVARAKEMDLKILPEFIRHLTEDFEHDYGTIVHALAAGAVATAYAMNRTDGGGISGFQAGGVMWQFITGWMSEYEGKPLRLINYADLLFPQYADKFEKIISPETAQWLTKEAIRNLENPDHASPTVIEHWKKIAAGQLPFGFQVKENG